MFAYIEGTLTYKSPSLLYLSVNNVGYEVHITLQTYSRLQGVDQCRLYTHLQVREDSWVLYGFADEEERSTFRLLLGISGVGAATARLILSSLTPEELESIIMREDARALEKVKGIGAKTAQRIILELKDKLLRGRTGPSIPTRAHNTTAEDALIALVNLGIARPAAEAAIKKIKDAPALTVEELIKQALRVL
jgi:Holliday junction DNA helicase RuvA